jgi:hypothetical protein
MAVWLLSLSPFFAFDSGVEESEMICRAMVVFTRLYLFVLVDFVYMPREKRRGVVEPVFFFFMIDG